jgi:hypothetical protein
VGRACSTLGREERLAYRILIGEPEGRRPLRRPDIEGRIIFKWILKK